MSEQLIQKFDLKLITPDCFPGADWYRAYLHLDDDITKALPYLNAELKCAEYDHSAKILLWMNDNKKYAFRPHEIVIAPVESREEAQMLANHIISTVNDIWSRKEEIDPNFQREKARPNVLDIYKLTPKTNCRECGLTCMAFATALRDNPSKLSLCPYFSNEEYKNFLMVGNIFAEIKLPFNITFKSNFGVDMGHYNFYDFDPEYFIAADELT